MSLYRYVKQENSVKKIMVSYFSYFTLTLGSLLLFWSFYPVISFEIYSRLFLQQQITTPVPSSQVASSITLANSVLGSYNVFSNNLRDFTQASLWFPTKAKE